MNGISTISCIVQDVIPEPHGLRIEWADEEVSFFDYKWLAENAPELRKREGRRIRTSDKLPWNLRPLYIHLHPNNVLEMGWNELSHTTCFSTVWLRQHCPAGSELQLT
jgi:Gamma-butyrobetaine hydroxylase-like, N-terminal